MEEIAHEAAVEEIENLRRASLEQCDRLARSVSTRAQWFALLEGAAAGLGGAITEVGNVPVLLAAAERAIRRIGHCYGYRLETEPDRQLVLAILELSTVDDPHVRQRLLAKLPVDGQSAPIPSPSLNGTKKAVLDDLVLEVVPFVGDALSTVLDYAFVRRVDVTARRVFQERWLRDNGTVDKIPPAKLSHRVQTGRAARELAAEAFYLGGYGLGFVVTAPIAVAGALAARLPGPVVRGASDGARDAIESADELAAGWQSLAEPAHFPAAGPAKLPA